MGFPTVYPTCTQPHASLEALRFSVHLPIKARQAVQPPKTKRAWTRFFWMSAIFSGRQSSPRLPRDMMIPSASLSTPLKLSRAWGG